MVVQGTHEEGCCFLDTPGSGREMAGGGIRLEGAQYHHNQSGSSQNDLWEVQMYV